VQSLQATSWRTGNDGLDCVDVVIVSTTESSSKGQISSCISKAIGQHVFRDMSLVHRQDCRTSRHGDGPMGCINIYILNGECHRAKAIYPVKSVPSLTNYFLPSLFTCIQGEYGVHTAT
jgi:hypothetical protein